jgi:DNA mismatch repair protein MLH1
VFQSLGRYAGVGITLKRSKQAKADILTLPRFSRTDVIRAVYGSAVSKNVRPFSAASPNWPERAACPPSAEEPTFSVEGLVSTGDTAVKRTSLIIFINGRPTECTPFKAALDSAYAMLHSKAASYWAFVDVRVPASHVDVNIHPTKSEVALLFQPELIEAVRAAVEAVLSTCHDVRSFARSGAAAATPIPGAFCQAQGYPTAASYAEGGLKSPQRYIIS